MKKIIILAILFFAITSMLSAQDQTVKGNLILQYNESLNSPIGSYGNKLYFGSINDNQDPIFISRYNWEADRSDLRINVGDDYKDRLVIGRRFVYHDQNAFTSVLVVHPNAEHLGLIGINRYVPFYTLDVNGNVSLRGDDITTPIGQYGHKLYFGHETDNTDNFFISRFNTNTNKSELRVNIGDDIANNNYDKFMVGATYNEATGFKSTLTVLSTGKVGIGTDEPAATLDVNGTIRAKEVKIEATGWADFVFDKNYNLPSLDQVEAHIKENNTLPGIPSEKEVLENGVNVVEMQTKLLQKIEELTLYIIQQDKKIDDLNKRLNSQNQ